MLSQKMHFEQVPLEMVKKILEDQTRLEIAAERSRQIKELTLEEDPLREQEQSTSRVRAFSLVEPKD
jgi:hypothetical protein